MNTRPSASAPSVRPTHQVISSQIAKPKQNAMPVAIRKRWKEINDTGASLESCVWSGPRCRGSGFLPPLHVFLARPAEPDRRDRDQEDQHSRDPHEDPAE